MEDIIYNELISILNRGSITLPKKVRDILNLKTGDILKLEVVNNEIILRPQKVLDIDPDQAWFWSEESQKNLSEALDDVKHNRVKRFSNMNDLTNELNNG